MSILPNYSVTREETFTYQAVASTERIISKCFNCLNDSPANLFSDRLFEVPCSTPRRVIRSRSVDRDKSDDLEMQLLTMKKLINKLCLKVLRKVADSKEKLGTTLKNSGTKISSPEELPVKPRPKTSTHSIMDQQYRKVSSSLLNTIKGFEKEHAKNKTLKLEGLKSSMESSKELVLKDSYFVQNSSFQFKAESEKPCLMLSESSIASEIDEEYFNSKVRIRKVKSHDDVIGLPPVYDSNSEEETDEEVKIAVVDYYHILQESKLNFVLSLIFDINAFLQILILSCFIAFSDLYDENQAVNWFIRSFSLLSDTLCLLEILVELNRVILDKNGDQVLCRKLILKHYARSWLFTDSLAAFPSLIWIIFINTEFKIILSILIIIRFVKINKDNNLFRKSLLVSDLNFNRFLKFLTSAIVLTHYSCCYWIFIGLLNGPSGWVQVNEISQNAFELYSNSLYFCMMTIFSIGYGDIIVETQSERVFEVMFMIFAVGLFSFLLSSLSNIFTKKISEEEILVNLNILTEISRETKIPPDLYKKIKQFVESNCTKTNKLKAEFISNLPINLKTIMHYLLFTKSFKNLKFLQGKSQFFILSIYPLFQIITYSKNELVFRIGSEVQEMLILLKGGLSLKMDGNNHYLQIGLIKENESIGEVNLYFNEPFGYDILTNKLVTSCLIMKKADFLELEKSYTQALYSIVVESMKRMELIEMRRNLLLNLNDLNLNKENTQSAIIMLNELVFERNYLRSCEKEKEEYDDKQENINLINAIVAYYNDNFIGDSYEEGVAKVKEWMKRISRNKVFKRNSQKLVGSGKMKKELMSQIEKMKENKVKVRSKDKAYRGSIIILNNIKESQVLKSMNSDFLRKKQTVRRNESLKKSRSSSPIVLKKIRRNIPKSNMLEIQTLRRISELCKKIGVSD